MRITPITTSRFRSDGGAMFGAIPKPLWARCLEPDDQNRVAQAAHCLLVELDDGRRGLVDTGCGDPGNYSQKERMHHALEETPTLPGVLAGLGIAAREIDFVVLSHLHWDHLGGIARADASGKLELAFPRAVFYVHADEWETAKADSPLLPKAYDTARVGLLREQTEDRLLLVADLAPNILPGVRMARSGGHTAGHCAVVLSGDPLEIIHPAAAELGAPTMYVYAGDVCPTSHHLPVMYQTSFDTQPLSTRAWKLEMFPEIAEEGAVLHFCHDPERIAATLRPADNGRGYVPDRILPAP